ncbi:hypothetical protein HON88_01300 [Candidatus Woesearchaeota archaeon]|mgnify:FL=1|nr:hypothetical protein [Candidatus Woesearchaeota archaeon]
MAIRYRELVKDLAEARVGLIEVIRKIEGGDKSAVDKLDSLIFDEKRMFSEDNKELFVLNTQAVKGIPRFNGNPFMIHPASAAWLFAYLAANEKKLGRETAEDRDKIIGFILTHDFLEEGLKYKEGRFAEAVTEWGYKHTNALVASVLMSSSHALSMNERVEIVHQVKTYGSAALAYATIIEKLDNMLDLEYVKTKRNPDIQASIKGWWISQPLFVLKELQDRIPEMYWPTLKICRGVIQDNSDVTYRSVYKKFKKYRQDLHGDIGMIRKSAEEHLQRYNLLSQK